MSDADQATFTKDTGAVLALVAGLLAFAHVADWAQRFPIVDRLAKRYTVVNLLDKVPGAMRNGDLNPQDVDALGAGYYEDLRKDAGPVGLPKEREDLRFRDDFLRYEMRPFVKRPYPGGMRISNSFGLANPEYPYEKPPHTRRIALLGDSMSLGPYGHDYPALLEDRLNRDYVSPEVRKFELLNFAVYGYSVLQEMDVALDKAGEFHPDVYVLALTHLEFIPRAGWRTHIGRLLWSGTDLKYPFLRDVVAKAGVHPTDRLPTMRIKLAPYSQAVTRWALEQIRDAVASRGARMIVILVAAPIDPNIAVADFNRLHQMADGLGVPVVDLRDTFQSQNLYDLQVVPRTDIHPNAKGHELIFQNLLAKLRAQPDAWSALVGGSAHKENSGSAASH